MRAFLAILVCILLLTMTGCSSLEKQSYTVIVGAKAFLDAERNAHPECINSALEPPPALCVELSRATAAKDLLVDATEEYCAGPQFETGGQCRPPAKGTPAFTQAVAKVQAAIANYNQVAADLKGAM
jgi:hypothetical protein